MADQRQGRAGAAPFEARVDFVGDDFGLFRAGPAQENLAVGDLNLSQALAQIRDQNLVRAAL